MARSNGNARLGINLEPTSQAPLDARLVVNSVADLYGAYPDKNYYIGMVVSIIDEQSQYMLVDAVNVGNAKGWKRVDAGSASFNSFTKVINSGESIGIPASEHNCGTNPLVRTYFNGDECQLNYTQSETGDLTFTWNGELDDTHTISIVINQL